MNSLLIFLVLATSSFVLSAEYNCLWSTYRPGPYFGLRSLTKDSPLFGLQWYVPKKMDSVKNLRHFMEPSDNITKYEWKVHDGCEFGNLKIQDQQMNLSFEVTFSNTFTVDSGNHWVVRVNGTETNNNIGVVFMWYITNPAKNADFGITYENNSITGNYSIGNTSTSFYATDLQHSANKHPNFNGTDYNVSYSIVMDISNDKLYDPSEYIIGELKDTIGYEPNHLLDPKDSYRSISISKGNTFVRQYFLLGNFSFDVHFFDNKLDYDLIDQQLTSSNFLNKLNSFNLKYSQIFKGSKKPISKINDSDRQITAQSALSTLFSNLLYMNGYINIIDVKSQFGKKSRNLELLTIGPDKTSHSRGFMWDEGFQQRILFLWNSNTSMKIVSNWFANIENSGWLPREQSLDNESRSRAPPSSWAAIPDDANPPSLYLYLEDLFNKNIDNSTLTEYFKGMIENLEKNAKWFHESQRTNLSFVFAWKAKTDEFCLSSGLDDYPRTKLNGTNLVEGHVDMQSWIIVISRVMVKIYSFLGEQYFTRQVFWEFYLNKTRTKLINEFWDPTKKRFDDFFIDKDNNKVFAGHTGYIQLFPFFLDILNATEFDQIDWSYTEASLNLVLNYSEGLRTNFGIRSLSSKDPSYMSGQNYWTSPIWINLNYLIIRQLYRLSLHPKFKSLTAEYQNIRNSVVNNMVKNFKQNGYIWEVYNDQDGHGMYNHPFTGWSALVVNLIYELF